MKHLVKILINGTLLCVLWIAGTLLINGLLTIDIPATGDPGTGLLLMWLCCLLEAASLHFYLLHIQLSRKYRWVMVAITIFMIQFVFTQIESVYYLDAQTIPAKVILSTVLTGLFMSLLFSVFVNSRYPAYEGSKVLRSTTGRVVFMVLLMGIVIYPMIYFLAGYFIAWQSGSLRVYYTGSEELRSFYVMMQGNFQNGIYTFQIMRGIVWTLLGVLILQSLKPASWKFQGLILGLLFSALMSAQLLITNPYMPDDVRLMHGIETATSNFVWGLLLAFGWHLTFRIKPEAVSLKLY